jgi:hypothetical protein
MLGESPKRFLSGSCVQLYIVSESTSCRSMVITSRTVDESS